MSETPDTQVERLRGLLHCGTRHPEIGNAVPCGLDKGHDGEHVSSTGCAGSVLRWPSALFSACHQRDEARAVLGAVAALADQWEGFERDDILIAVVVQRLRAALAPVSGAVDTTNDELLERDAEAASMKRIEAAEARTRSGAVEEAGARPV